MKVYTKTGDKGQTSLFAGTRVSKSDVRIEAYGTVDEANSWMAVLRDHCLEEDLDILIRIQNNLFSIGSILATEKETTYKIPQISVTHIQSLEEWMDNTNQTLPELRSFVLPGGHASISYAHLARTVVRRSERRVVALSEMVDVPDNVIIYLNRLSDFLFVLARKLTYSHHIEEVEWKSE